MKSEYQQTTVITTDGQEYLLTHRYPFSHEDLKLLNSMDSAQLDDLLGDMKIEYTLK